MYSIELVSDIDPGSKSSSPYEFIVFDGQLFFAADDGSSGIELWTTDGSNVGTQLFKDIRVGRRGSEPRDLTVFGDQLFFSAEHGVPFAREVWVSDGTDAGTQLFKDIVPGNFGSNPRNFTVVDDQLFFIASDVENTNGSELWVTDGTNTGTQRVKDIVPGKFGSNIKNMTAFDGKLFFSSDDGTNGRQLWISNGTEAGTQLVKAVQINATQDFVVFQDKLFFRGVDNNGQEPWVSDGTAAGTSILKDIEPNGSSGTGSLTFFSVVDDQLFFNAETDKHGHELWVTDGTESGTRLVRDINPGSAHSSVRNPIAFDGKLFFAASDGTRGLELWVSDGTEAGTQLVKDIYGGKTGSNPRDFAIFGDKLVFVIDGGTAQRPRPELWMTDGTSAGTQSIGDIGNVQTENQTDFNFVVFNENLYFNAEPDPNNIGMELYTLECFLSGSQILTESGEVAVEALKIGDKVQTAEGTLEPIKWIGRQTCQPHQVKNPLRGYPILVKAGALGNNLPHRDLYVSPDHALLVEGLLINAGALVNGVSILKTQPTEAFTYYHIELDKHALLIAEGTAAESYLPQKEDRLAYDNGAEYEELYPHDNKIILWPLDYPRVSSYTTVPRYIRKKLMAIATALGLALQVS